MHDTGPASTPAPADRGDIAGNTAGDSTGDTGEAIEQRGEIGKHARRFGLPIATCLVMGNIIGGGIFRLPHDVASYGTISLVAFAVLTLGAIALALVFGRLAQRDPRTGGPYVYAREAFGDFAGFLAAWSYWITSWVSNAALAVGAVGYLNLLIDIDGHWWTMCLAALVIQWLPGLANLAGTRYVGAVQLVATVLKFAPLLLVAIGGLFFFDADNLGPFQADPNASPVGAVSAAAALLLFSYLGVESAAVSAGEVRDPRRNVGRATILGVLGAAFVYLLGTLAVFGTVPYERLIASEAPFSDAVNAMFGGTWGGTLVAVAAVVSILGALNGWTLLSAQAPFAAAKDGLFPSVFLKKQRGVPTAGVVITVILASLLTVYNYASGGGNGDAEVFTLLVTVTTFMATVPYLLATAAQIYYLLSGQSDRVNRSRLVRDSVIAAIACGFSLWLVGGAGYAAVYQGVVFLFIGVVVYAVMSARKKKAETGQGA